MIDAHQHFWDLSRGDYAWPNADVAAIFRDFGPDELVSDLHNTEIRQTILIQATDTVAETEYMLQLAQDFTAVAAVVGWVDLSAPDAISTIDRLRANPLLKGLRPMLQNIEDTDWILRPEVQPALAHMEKVGLCFDALIQPRHLPTLLQVAKKYENLSIVIDHIAKPRMGSGILPATAWSSGMQDLAALNNVYCKLSGMMTEIGPLWQQQDLEPFADQVIEAFGADRILWGSDWPVVNLAGDYKSWLESARGLTQQLSEAERDNIFGGSARNFYGITR